MSVQNLRGGMPQGNSVRVLHLGIVWFNQGRRGGLQFCGLNQIAKFTHHILGARSWKEACDGWIGRVGICITWVGVFPWSLKKMKEVRPPDLCNPRRQDFIPEVAGLVSTMGWMLSCLASTCNAGLPVCVLHTLWGGCKCCPISLALFHIYVWLSGDVNMPHGPAWVLSAWNCSDCCFLTKCVLSLMALLSG